MRWTAWLILSLAWGAEKHTPVSPRADLRSDSTVVLINVTVTDASNRFVTGLQREQFSVLEGKTEQRISYFSEEDAPSSIGIVFDTSSSMERKLSMARQAVAELCKTANPEDEFLLIEFSGRPQLVAGFSEDTATMRNHLLTSRAHGRTALLDAIALGLQEMKQARYPRKSLVIFSDGGDNSSRRTEREIRNMVSEGDVRIYSIGILSPAQPTGGLPEEDRGPALLSDLALQTGGRSFPVTNVSKLPEIAERVGREMRNEYILGYIPTDRSRDGKYRQVKVKLAVSPKSRRLSTSWRRGYYAPVN